MAQELEVKDGDVIWTSVGSGFPKWPCKVMEIGDNESVSVESFGDHVHYSNKKVSTFIKFTEDNGSLVTTGRKKLRSKKHYLDLFETAIKEAVDYIHADIDPDFQLQELDASFNVSSSLDSSMDTSHTSIEHTPSITNSSRKRTRKSTQMSAKKHCSLSQTSESTNVDICTLDNADANVLTPYRKRSLRNQSSSDLKPSSPQQSFSEGEVLVAMDCLLQTPTSESISHNNQPSTELSDSSPQCNISMSPLNTSACHETETCSTYQSETSEYKTDATQETKASDYQSETSDHESKISVPESETLNAHTETSVEKTNVITKSVDESTTLESAANSASVSPTPDIPVESESDDDLPQVDFSGQDWTPASIKPNDIIWAKYERYPYWPALVHSINIKKKRVRVFFLGWPDDHSIPFKYNKSKKNLAAFNYQNTEKFKHESSEQLDKLDIRDAFNLALNEADQLHLRRENKEIDGPPEIQYKLICQKRPLNAFENIFLPSKPTRMISSDSDKNPNVSVFGYDISSSQKELWGDSKDDDDQSDVSGDWDDEENEIEDTSLPYCFTHIKEQFEQFKPELEKICRGEIYSELHQIFTTGLSKERGAMKYQEKYGPADHLSDKKKMELFYILQDIAEKVFDGQRNFTYVYDVLLPEAMARTISAIDKCSLEDAWKKLHKDRLI